MVHITFSHFTLLSVYLLYALTALWWLSFICTVYLIVFLLICSLMFLHSFVIWMLQLTSPRMAVRKRSILALGHLVPCCSPALFSQLTEHLMKELAKGPPTSMTRTYIQCLATISRQGGHRVGELMLCLCRLQCWMGKQTIRTVTGLLKGFRCW